MPAPTRRFTRAELTSTITIGMYNAMSSADREAFDHQLTALWADNYNRQAVADFEWDARAAARGVIEP